ncbi:hypothetical protein EVA_09993 [gut metagenome]|uniref:Uncharacterized protein n=1 Tax=gut metagenome TaxID=749906 RepID=J9GPJ1_9ZZZZ
MGILIVHFFSEFLKLSRQLFEHGREAPHIAHLQELSPEVVQIEAIAFGEFDREFFRFGNIDRLLHILDKTDDVAHAENSGCHGFRIEGAEAGQLFCRPDKLNGLAGNVTDRKGRPASAVAVHLGENHAG